MNPRLSFLLGLGLLVCAGGCQSLYYDTMETFGRHKRDIMVDRVENAKDAQEEAKEQFASALEEFLAISEVEPGQLREAYDRVKAAYDASEKRARAVRERIRSIKSVADSLFKEWEKELDLYTSDQLRASSRRQLEQTKALYSKMIEAMDGAAARMDPVLDAFRDQTLFLKHNLNAQAVASLNETTVEIQDEVRELIEDMEDSIKEANAFIDQMRERQE